MTSFADMKRNRRKQISDLATKSKELSKGKFEEDARIWKPTPDKAGNAQAIVRFLPTPDGENDPWVRVWDHFFQGPGGWYVEKSLTTIDQDDPLGEYNSKLWNSGEEGQEQARKQKRRLSFYSNVYIVEDKANPAAEGQVFIYRYGKQIFDKINDAMNPTFDGEEPINPFDLWDGADFRVRIYRSDNFPRYDRCAFAAPAPLFDDESKLEEAWRRCHPLAPFVDESTFKTYQELKTKLDRVLGIPAQEVPPLDLPPRDNTGGVDRNEDTVAPTADEQQQEAAERFAFPDKESAPPPAETAPMSTSADEDAAYFAALRDS